MGIITGVSVTISLILAITEVHTTSTMFQVSQLNLNTSLYGDGGPVFILILSLCSALAYSCLISLRVFQKSGSRRSSTFTYSIVMLGIQGTRTLGAILLAADVEVSKILLNN